jgi:hypothetical protein
MSPECCSLYATLPRCVCRLKEDLEAERGKLRKSVAARLDLSAPTLAHLQDKHHKMAVTCVAVSPDGHSLYTASKDKVCPERLERGGPY